MSSLSDLVMQVLQNHNAPRTGAEGRSRVLTAMRWTWMEIQRRGDVVGRDGWPFLRARTTVSVTLTASGDTTIEVPDLRQIIAIRTSDGTSNPNVLKQVPLSQLAGYQSSFTNTTGSALQFYAVSGLDRSTGQIKLFFYPRIAGTITLEIIYEKRGATLIDSPLSADKVEIPIEYEEALVLGTEFRLCRVGGKPKRRMEAKQEFEAALQQLAATAVRTDGYERITARSEDTINAGQADPRVDTAYPWL